VTDSDSSGPGKPVGRRVFLGLLGLGAVGVVFGDAIQTGFSKVLNPVVQRDPTGVLGAALPVQGFRFYTVTNGYPSRSRTAYTLSVKGLVDQPFTLTYDELTAMPPTLLTKDFQCVTGWRVPNVHWKGVKLGDLLDRAHVQPAGKALRFTSFDGTYTESLTLDQARRDDVIVAYELGGNPLSRQHGGPVRLYVAPMYGYKSCKWLDGIEVVDHVIPGFWEEQGYDVNAWVGRSNGRDDQPTSQ
jgi:DMSO/TMAO reductase YedYZ molybdopterin-dependent catalytic subunit